MKKHRVIGIVVLVLWIIPAFTNAQMTTSGSVKNSYTFPFGGRVLTTTIPTVTCLPPGTGPVVLMSNIVSLGSAVYSGTNKQQTGFERASGVVSGVYNALPFYTTSITKVPKPGQWILGRHEIIPDIKTCVSEALAGFPIPVKRTTTYGVSGQSWNNK